VSRTNPLLEGLREAESDLLRFIAEAPWDEEPRPDEAFSRLALRTFRLQCDAIPEYGAYARHLGRAPDQICGWREIPPVPASAFRSHDLSAAPRDREGVTFETSGTTISLPGRVRLSSTSLYEASLTRNFTRHLLPDGARLRAIVFGPRREEAARSSLWFMVEHVARERCEGAMWIVDHGEPRWEHADEALARAAEEGRPVLLLGTTLLFHANFTRCDRKGLRFTLPPGSRAMDTGGSKGARVAVSRREVASAFRRVLGIPPTHLVNEYGMAEMGSQFYEDALFAAHGRTESRPGFMIPPWVRTRVLDPETMRERREGTPGLLVHYDLANLEIPLAIQTEDVGTLSGPRLLLEGRLPEAARRGCSLPFERFLDRERVAEGEPPPGVPR
jgi:hypothetical protein